MSSKPALIAAFIFFFYTGTAQKIQPFKGECGSFFENMTHLFKINQVELDFYQFEPGQVVASVGAGCGHREAKLHGACNLPMRTSDQVNELSAKNRLEFNYAQIVPVRKIFAFRLKN